MRSKTTESPTRSSACFCYALLMSKSTRSRQLHQTTITKLNRQTRKFSGHTSNSYDGQITEPNITYCLWQTTRSNALFIGRRNQNTDSVHNPQLETSLCMICIILNFLSLQKQHLTIVAMMER